MQQLPDEYKLSAIDLFAGGGGLTLGLKNAGFSVISAVELEPNAFTTYKANHPEVKAFKQDIRTIKGHDFPPPDEETGFDLIAGCPPCQGFSSLTSKYKKEDPRNDLIKELTRLIIEIKPRAVMMENVPGLAMKGKPLFDECLKTLEDAGYQTTWDILQVADFGVPQNRRRLVLLAGYGFKIDLPKKTHSNHPKDGLLKWRTVRDTIQGIEKPVDRNYALENGGIQKFNWHVYRNMNKKNLDRIKKVKPGRSRNELSEELRPACHKGLNKGFTNVYGRMSWDEPSPTITGGCTVFSKGRFGHPTENRTISVREAALLQTFPEDYYFDTEYMDHVCKIIGNALPCDFAEILSRTVMEALINNEPMAKNN